MFVVIGLAELSVLLENEPFYIYYDYYCAVCRIFKLTTAPLYDIFYKYERAAHTRINSFTGWSGHTLALLATCRVVSHFIVYVLLMQSYWFV